MILTLSLDKSDIVANKVGKNLIIYTQNGGPHITLTPDAVDELMLDLKRFQDERNKDVQG